MRVLFIHEMFLVYKLETFTNCKEVKHVMVMIIAIIFYLMSYLINSWKLLSENPQPRPPPPTPPQKKNIHPHPLLLFRPLKIQKVQVAPLFANIEDFSGPSCRKGG